MYTWRYTPKTPINSSFDINLIYMLYINKLNDIH